MHYLPVTLHRCPVRRHISHQNSRIKIHFFGLTQSAVGHAIDGAEDNVVPMGDDVGAAGVRRVVGRVVASARGGESASHVEGGTTGGGGTCSC